MRLRELRYAAGMTQADVARRIDVSDVSVSNWETGRAKPRPASLAALADLFEVPVADLDPAAGPRDGHPFEGQMAGPRHEWRRVPRAAWADLARWARDNDTTTDEALVALVQTVSRHARHNGRATFPVRNLMPRRPPRPVLPTGGDR